ncbi:efflux RND transporter periplasmic adaptor subunit [Pseudoduganella umbonata]|uniref:Efflux RND transporter periplasmic adaptor subunit n=1 Tax=Pseudoduganella umbonata TaxID=864828 RepID=A0A4P8HWZ6_9BURK|nr:efflux RND transporter periplasmic adaptor subunit [Pseudoduganella umbonata]MBB3222816.1 RND family efflux transporter MFP subunit [Pseudoduganella umbonata]QCP12955.1 efflux RND transporter periplasmic adaptor subunit [Pseudoduganella umbonata]
MKKSTLGVLVAAAVAVGAGAWQVTRTPQEEGHAAAGQGKGQEKGQERGQGPTTVNVVAPTRQDVPVMLQANGTVSPISTVDLHPQTTSTIVKVHVKEGDFVKEGQLMFSLDSRSESANLQKAQAEVARDRANLADLERQYKRSMELLGQKFIAQGAVDTLKSQVDAARAEMEANIAAARAIQVGQSYTAIRAPMSGRVGGINVYPGSLVQLSTSLTTITQLDPINVAFTVPETSLAALLDAQRAGKVPVQVFHRDSKTPIEGHLSFIDNTVDPQAGVIRVKAQFANRDTRLWPGQYVNTEVTVQTLRDALVVPQNAIITNTRGTFVYTVGPDGTARVANVERLHAFGANAAVRGLAGNERVIVEGKQNLRPGGKVRVSEVRAPEAQLAEQGKVKGGIE